MRKVSFLLRFRAAQYVPPCGEEPFVRSSQLMANLLLRLIQYQHTKELCLQP